MREGRGQHIGAGGQWVLLCLGLILSPSSPKKEFQASSVVSNPINAWSLFLRDRIPNLTGHHHELATTIVTSNHYLLLCFQTQRKLICFCHVKGVASPSVIQLLILSLEPIDIRNPARMLPKNMFLCTDEGPNFLTETLPITKCISESCSPLHKHDIQ